MRVEQHTNYAYKLKYMDNPTFDKVRDLSTKFYRELPQALQDELFEALNRGIDILDSEPQMTTYLYAFGKMHQAKLEYAFSKLPKEFLKQPEINIIDYGCGQALGTMCYADYLRENGYSQKIKTITLIEPSEMCLRRAALHASVFFPDAEANTINKSFDELKGDTICFDENIPTLHILSNVLDILDFDLVGFANLIKEHIKGYNQFICVGPYFNYSDKDNRMKDFLSFMQGKEIFSKPFDKFEFDKDKAWTAQVLCFSIGGMTEEKLSTEVTDEDIENGVKDEFGVIYSLDGKRLLKCENEKIVSYTINKSTRIICDDAFMYCGFLKQITIHNSVTSIGQGAFYWCESLRQIDIPDSVTKIGKWAFSHCISLCQITIPDSVLRIGANPFSFCNNLIINSKSTRFVIEDGLLIDKQSNNVITYLGHQKNIIIPNSVFSIGEDAFLGCESLQQINIPDSVLSIGNGAFSHCKSLQQITIPDSVVMSIGDDSFSYCISLKQITIPNTVTVIGNGAFSKCESLKHLIIPNSVTSIGNKAFIFCKSLQQLIIPNSVTSIGYKAFAQCISLQQINIPESVINIGAFAFSGCISLRQITIPNSELNLGTNPFSNCKNLQLKSKSKRFLIANGLLIDKQCNSIISYIGHHKSIIIPNSVYRIGNHAFSECESLQQIIIPNSVTNIGEWAFSKCESLKQIIIPDSIANIDNGMFFHCKLLQQISIPDSVTSIGKRAFFHCKSLRQITIPDSVTSIGDWAFSECESLKHIIIPKNSVEKFKQLLPKELWDKLYYLQKASNDCSDDCCFTIF